MEEVKQDQAADFLNEKKKKHTFRLYRKLFLLVFALAMLWQGILLMDNYAKNYYAQLKKSFKVLLTLSDNIKAEELNKLGEKIRLEDGIEKVSVFDVEQAMAEVHRQNPQLADTLVLLGSHKMPAYIEAEPSDKAIVNIESLTDSLAVHYPQINVRYNKEHARLTANASLFCKILNLVQWISLLALILFMFLVESHACKAAHAGAGVFSGLLAGFCAGAVTAGLLYPTGYLPDIWAHLICVKEQVLLVVFSGLLGWTFSKWQRF
jgi:hypothetical protein